MEGVGIDVRSHWAAHERFGDCVADHPRRMRGNGLVTIAT
jgi:hypothetical protein